MTRSTSGEMFRVAKANSREGRPVGNASPEPKRARYSSTRRARWRLPAARWRHSSAWGSDGSRPASQDSSQSRLQAWYLDRKSTRLNSSHVKISYAVFCLKKKKINKLKNSLQ